MDAREAREQLEMVDRILSRAEPPKGHRPWTWALVVLGIAAALLEVGSQVSRDGHGNAVIEAGAGLMAAGYLYMIWVAVVSKRNAGRLPAGEARIGKASAAVWTAIFIAFWAQPHIFSDWALGAIWNVGGAIQMLMFGYFGDRRAFIAGLLIALSIPAANWSPQPGYVLAGGFIVGYVVPGILMALDKDEQEEARG